MEVINWDITTSAPTSCRQSVVSIGNFDGVHKGHAALLRRLNRLRDRLGYPSLVATFDPSPITLLRPDLHHEPLTTLEQKLQLLSLFKVDRVLVFQTNAALLALNAAAFWNRLLMEQLQIRGMVEGGNFYFGRDREGTVQLLRKWSAERKLPLEIVHDVGRRGQRVSSSAIRDALKQGDVDWACSALGRYYSVTGKVAQGDQRGSRIGFPTANLMDIPTLVPGTGVYAALARLSKFPLAPSGSEGWDEGGIHAAAVNIGPNPTFGVEQSKVEAHLLDFQGDLYGQQVRLEFIARLRATQPFDSVQALQKQLAQDVARTREICQRARISPSPLVGKGWGGGYLPPKSPAP
jgi:riboflavin kinase/FMN adenylyltransferase